MQLTQRQIAFVVFAFAVTVGLLVGNFAIGAVLFWLGIFVGTVIDFLRHPKPK